MGGGCRESGQETNVNSMAILQKRRPSLQDTASPYHNTSSSINNSSNSSRNNSSNSNNSSTSNSSNSTASPCVGKRKLLSWISCADGLRQEVTTSQKREAFLHAAPRRQSM